MNQSFQRCTASIDVDTFWARPEVLRRCVSLNELLLSLRFRGGWQDILLHHMLFTDEMRFTD